MRGTVIVVQIVITFAIVAVTMPVALALVPSVRDSAVGPGAALALAAVVFVLLRLGWPRRRR